MSPELAAAVAADEMVIAEWLERIGVPEPGDAAARHMRWLRERGWRKSLALADRPAEPRRAPAAIRRQAVAEATAAIQAAKDRRPELEVPR